MSANGKSDILTPKQALFKEFYLNPKSETFGNATRSAIRAGYEESYANSITRDGNDWVAEIVRDADRLRKAEKVLDRTLDMIDDEDVARQKLAHDTAKFVAKSMGREKYAERTEVTGKDGEPLPTLIKIISPDERDSVPTEPETGTGA
jgi:phage terminase small subunit